MTADRGLTSGTADRLVDVGSLAVLYTVLVVTADVLGAKFLGFRIPDLVVMTQIAMVIVVFTPLLRLELSSQNLAVTMIYDRLKTRTQAILDVVNSAATLTFFGLLAWGSTQYLLQSIRLGERTLGLLQIPLAPVKGVVAVSLVLLTLHLCRRFVLSVVRLVRGPTAEPPGPAGSSEPL